MQHDFHILNDSQFSVFPDVALIAMLLNITVLPEQFHESLLFPDIMNSLNTDFGLL